SFDETKETCRVEWAGNAYLTLPTSLFRALKAEIQPPRRKSIPVEDLKAILRRKGYAGPVRLENQKAWASLLGGCETVPQIATAAKISKESAYKYRDMWLKYGIVLVNGEQVSPHPEIRNLTGTE